MLNTEIVANGFVRLTNWFNAHEIWDCGGCALTWGCVFIESYEIRAALITERVLALEKAGLVAESFCDCVVSTQGVTEENMYFMGYGHQRNSDGIPSCSCVADAASTAMVLVDYIKAHPESPKNEKYLNSLRKYVDHVLGKYARADGVIGVGILGHKINPMPDYWCANALFAPVLIGVGEITGESKYLDAALAPLEFIASYDYRKTSWKEWEVCPTELIFYTCEGLLGGLLSSQMRGRLEEKPRGICKEDGQKPAVKSEPLQQALNRVAPELAGPGQKADRKNSIYALLKNRWHEFANWLNCHQEVNGIWQTPRDYRGYQCGLSWIMLQASGGLETNQALESVLERQLMGLVSSIGKSYFGLYCRPFATALAHLSFAAAAEVCRNKDPELFRKAYAEQQQNASMLW